MAEPLALVAASCSDRFRGLAEVLPVTDGLDLVIGYPFEDGAQFPVTPGPWANVTIDGDVLEFRTDGAVADAVSAPIGRLLCGDGVVCELRADPDLVAPLSVARLILDRTESGDPDGRVCGQRARTLLRRLQPTTSVGLVRCVDEVDEPIPAGPGCVMDPARGRPAADGSILRIVELLTPDPGGSTTPTAVLPATPTICFPEGLGDRLADASVSLRYRTLLRSVALGEEGLTDQTTTAGQRGWVEVRPLKGVAQ